MSTSLLTRCTGGLSVARTRLGGALPHTPHTNKNHERVSHCPSHQPERAPLFRMPARSGLV